MKTDKERYWTFIMYEDSRPEDWKEYLQQTGLQIAISPLHDKDINADETQKKPHYHVMVIFNGPTTYRRVEQITSYLNGTIPKRVMSPVGMIRYFTHEDNPEKAQYNKEDITTIGGLDIKDISGLTMTQIEVIKREIIKIIRAQDIKEYRALYDYCDDNNLKDFMEVISKNTIFFCAYLNSKRYECKDKQKVLKQNYNYDI